METIAVYWEPVIKTYGIQVRTDLALWSFTLPAGLFAQHPQPEEEGPDGRAFELVTATRSGDGRMRLHLVLSCVSHSSPWVDAIEKGCDDRQRVAPVAMVYLQGPHFGDRYGIAEAALSALARNRITILTAACTGASMHFVVPQHQAPAAREALSTVFVVPQSHDRPAMK